MKQLPILLVLGFTTLGFAQAATAPNATTGKTVILTATVATGTPTFIWTWKKNGVAWTPPTAPVNTAMTSIVTINNVQLTDAGSYTVNVYNVAGNTDSPPAVFTVSQTLVLPGGITLTIQIQ